MTPEYALAALRSALLRARLVVNEIETIGAGLKAGLVSPEAALLWARDAGALDIVGQEEIENAATEEAAS